MDYIQQFRDSIIKLFCLSNNMKPEMKKSMTTSDLYIHEDEEFLSEICPDVKENSILSNKSNNIKCIYKWECDHCGHQIIRRPTYMYKDHKFCSCHCKNSFDFSDFNKY